MAIQQERIVWLDWMKVLAILSIIWGHFFSVGYEYLYVFSVQAFCVISGFLYKKSPDWKTCIKKCFWQLFVPTVILSVIMQLEAYLRCMALGTTYDISWPWFFQWLLLGHRWCMGPCWYFYTLIVMRLIMQALPERKWVYALLFIALSAGAIVLHQQGIEVSNANVNVLVCMPMFLIGVFLKELKSVANNLSNYFVESVLAVGAGVVVYLCGWQLLHLVYCWWYGRNVAALCGVATTEQAESERHDDHTLQRLYPDYWPPHRHCPQTDGVTPSLLPGRLLVLCADSPLLRACRPLDREAFPTPVRAASSPHIVLKHPV